LFPLGSLDRFGGRQYGPLSLLFLCSLCQLFSDQTQRRVMFTAPPEELSGSE
jgi:hypothetical protein